MSLGTGAGMCAKDKEVEKTGQEGNAARQSKPEPEKTFLVLRRRKKVRKQMIKVQSGRTELCKGYNS
jgi:hypothetical protein